MAKNKMKKIDLDSFVFSTNPDFDFDQGENEVETLSPKEQNLIARLERKKRAGKTVTIVEGFIGNEDDLKELAKFIKNKCGTGGSVKDGEIIIQGDFRDKIVEALKKEAYKIKKSGG